MRCLRTIEFLLLLVVFFAHAGDPAPMVNEAHYLVKAKNFWDPDWCSGDLFAASGKAHVTYYLAFGWLTQRFSLAASAWIARIAGWCLVAAGLQCLTRRLISAPLASVGVAIVWLAGIEYADLAGEWVIGGTEAKVPAYGLILFALAAVVRRRWSLAWILLGLASAFHVVTGGWAVVATATVYLATERSAVDRHRFWSPGLVVGGMIAMAGLVPALALTWNAEADQSTTAARIYTYFRIRHHLLPEAFAVAWWIRHGTLILITAVMCVVARERLAGTRLVVVSWFAAGAVGIALVGVVIGCLPAVAPDLAARLLRFYWFRLTDAAVPLALGILAVHHATASPSGLNRLGGTVILVAASIGLIFAASDRLRYSVPPGHSNRLLGIDREAEPWEQADVLEDWKAVCWWVRQSTATEEVFLTPRHQQTFKWYAGRAEVVNFKDVPQDAASLIRWRDRFRDVFPVRLGTVRVTIQYRDLRRFRREYGVSYMIVDRRVVGPSLPLVQVYPLLPERNATYAVYELPR